MPSSRDTLRSLDASILSTLSVAGLTDEAVINGVTVPGYFREMPTEYGSGDETVEGLDIVFDCRSEDLPEVQPDDVVQVTGQGEFRLIGPEPTDGTGRRLLLLGKFL